MRIVAYSSGNSTLILPFSPFPLFFSFPPSILFAYFLFNRPQVCRSYGKDKKVASRPIFFPPFLPSPSFFPPCLLCVADMFALTGTGQTDHKRVYIRVQKDDCGLFSVLPFFSLSEFSSHTDAHISVKIFPPSFFSFSSLLIYFSPACSSLRMQAIVENF